MSGILFLGQDLEDFSTPEHAFRSSLLAVLGNLGLAGSRGDWTCQGGILAMGFQHCALADLLEHALGCLADDKNVSPWSWEA